MLGNYTVSHGTTLTIKPGTVIDMQDYWMEVEGTLIADDSTIMSSQTTATGSQKGVWDALTITSLGTALFDNVIISNAKSCLIVDGTLTATGLTLEDCLIGIEVDGTATISDLTASSIDNDGIRVTGDADLSGVQFASMSGGVHSSGDLILSGAEFTDIGTGLSLTGGTADVETLNFNSGIGNAVSISSAVSGDIDGMTGDSKNAIASMDAIGFTVSNVNMSGERLVNSWSAGNLSITNAVFNSDSTETPIDIRTSGTVTLSGVDLTGQFNSAQGPYNAPWIGIAIAGSGDYIIESSSIESSDTALISSGTGTLSITDSVFTSDRLGLSFSGISSTTLDNVVVNISTGGEIGIDILQGIHTFSGLEVNMPYNPNAADSTGIDAWWCEIIAEDVSVNGFANSMAVQESILMAEDLLLLNSTQQGLYASYSQITVTDEFQTKVSDSGIVMVASTGVFRTWTASYHEDGGIIDSDSEVTVWLFSTISNLDSDASGSGTLNYGTSQTLTVDTANSNRLWEMTISFEDLTGNPVDANWQVLGFSGTASAGAAVIPVSEAGSKITATYSGIGALSTPIGFQGGTHSIQVPIMPQTDWTLTAGTVVVLGPTEDGQPHLAGGNITIPANAKLILQDTTLELPTNTTITIDSYGDLEGHNSHLVSDVISHSGEFGNSETSDLTISGDVLWTSCQNNIILFGINVDGDIHLDNSCKVTITSGGVTGLVTVGVGATFEIVNTLEVTVLNKGEPVEGASITVQGQSVTTDAEGKATKTTTALLVDSTGTSISGLEQVTMQWGSIYGLMAWETSSSMQHTFIASTVSGGSLTEWLVLEKAWSPYYLSSNLVVPIGQTLTLNDGVFLRVTDGVTIKVEGTFNSGNSTISSTAGGARWGGLIIGDNNETSAQLLGTSLVEGSPLLTIDGYADVVLNNGLLSRTSGAEPLIRLTNAASGILNMSSTTLSDSSSHCIEAQGSAVLHMRQVTMKSCASDSIWARSLPLLIDGLQVTEKVDLSGVSGELINFEGGELHINNLDGFMMSDLTLTSINGSDNREIIIDGATINGTPALVLENTAGSISELTIDCGGSGVGVSVHHGRASAPVIISDSSISSCSKGIDLHTDGESAAIELNQVYVDSAVAISSDGNDMIIRNGALNGSLDINSANANLYDVTPLSESTIFGEIWMWNTHIISVNLGGNSHTANLELSVDEIWSTSVIGSSIEVAIPYTIVSDAGSQTTNLVDIVATSDNIPTLSQQYSYGPAESDIIEINMISNQAPNAQIITPDDGLSVMESIPIEVRAVVGDDLDSIEDLEVVWKVIVGQTEVMQLTGDWNNITDLPAGMYVLRLEVTDTQGIVSSQSMSFEITLLDSDGDWINSCNIETWFDKEESLYCGPDVYDTDDDNDGVSDNRDPWTTDPCASMDTDSDGQPDNLHCPPGVTTLLTADPDDDGDGIPDVSENAGSSEDSNESPIVIMLFVGIFIAAAVFMLMRSKQEVD
tara:strand:+ start:525 stop:4976 length:4452 start_codon:yes stop_codon:yes gene_type:complete